MAVLSGQLLLRKLLQGGPAEDLQLMILLGFFAINLAAAIVCS